MVMFQMFRRPVAARAGSSTQVIVQQRDANLGHKHEVTDAQYAVHVPSLAGLILSRNIPSVETLGLDMLSLRDGSGARHWELELRPFYGSLAKIAIRKLAGDCTRDGGGRPTCAVGCFRPLTCKPQAPFSFPGTEFAASCRKPPSCLASPRAWRLRVHPFHILSASWAGLEWIGEVLRFRAT